jgi:hypothetical protein
MSIAQAVCACSLRYRGCNAHASYCQLWPAQFYNRFQLYLTNDTLFKKKKQLLNIKCVFRVSLRSLSEKFLILRRNERDMITKVYWSS